MVEEVVAVAIVAIKELTSVPSTQLEIALSSVGSALKRQQEERKNSVEFQTLCESFNKVIDEKNKLLETSATLSANYMITDSFAVLDENPNENLSAPLVNALIAFATAYENMKEPPDPILATCLTFLFLSAFFAICGAAICASLFACGAGIVMSAVIMKTLIMTGASGIAVTGATAATGTAATAMTPAATAIITETMVIGAKVGGGIGAAVGALVACNIFEETNRKRDFLTLDNSIETAKSQAQQAHFTLASGT